MGNEDHFGNSTSVVSKSGLWLWSSSSDLFQLQASTKECTRDYILHRISVYIRGMRIILGIVPVWSQSQGCGCGPAPVTYFSYKHPLKNVHVITFYTG